MSLRYLFLTLTTLLLFVGMLVWYSGLTLPFLSALPTPTTPEGFLGGLRELKDKDIEEVIPTQVVQLKDGDTFELEASIVKQKVGNREIKRLAYNKQIPGPILKVEKGARISVNFKNSIDMATALHSHGLRGNYLFDGAAPITPVVKEGDTFTYELVFPDTGVFWYHPHVREDYQQDMGLYGNFIVEEKGYWNEVSQEEFLILDDFLEAGDYDPILVTNTLMGRYGDTLLINDTENFTLRVTQGQISRLFVTNVASTRTFDLSFANALTKIVGGDNGRVEKEYSVENTYIAPSERYVFELLYTDTGTFPILNRGKKIGEVVVVASDRDDQKKFGLLRENKEDYATLRRNFTEFLSRTPDKNIRLDIELKNSVLGAEELQTNEDGTIQIMGYPMTKEEAIEHCNVMPQMKECGPLLKSTSIELVSLAGESMSRAQAEQYCALVPTTEGCEKYTALGVAKMHTHPEGIEWEDEMLAINQVSSNNTVEWIIEDQDTRKKNTAIDWKFKTGDLVKVRIKNDGEGVHPMHHPIHFHGQRFVVLARDGVPNENLQWKDTVLIPMGKTFDILVDMSNPGLWMSHCHIAEHMQSGMMFNFRVE